MCNTYIFLSVLESFASRYSLCMLITEIYHASQGVACFCLNQKYLSNAKVMIFWNVMQSLADDANVTDGKCYERKEGRKEGSGLRISVNR